MGLELLEAHGDPQNGSNGDPSEVDQHGDSEREDFLQVQGLGGVGDLDLGDLGLLGELTARQARYPKIQKTCRTIPTLVSWAKVTHQRVLNRRARVSHTQRPGVRRRGASTFEGLGVEHFGLTEEAVGGELGQDEDGPEEVDDAPNGEGVPRGRDQGVVLVRQGFLGFAQFARPREAVEDCSDDEHDQQDQLLGQVLPFRRARAFEVFVISVTHYFY